ncbi:LacI family DNA-binding transcriptional regulator [Metabacillus iocasae]|nr:LacI family DNA-binding transcriptional regulator [Metabacillus iocasae]
MVKIVDVAKKANVSTATVSRVLTNSSAVKKDTAEKVLAAIEALNYQPNLLARQLRRMETKTILVVVPDITNTFFSKVLRGIEFVANQSGYQVLLGDSLNDSKKESDYLHLLRQRKADGMILLTARLSEKEIEEIALEFPVVLACEYTPGLNVPTVSIDNVQSAKKATDYLVSLGYKRIGFISGPFDVVLGRDRLEGFRQSMIENKLGEKDLLVQEGDFTFESGYAAMGTFLDMQEPPEAIFAANDEMAIGAIKAIHSKGLKVPNDISVVGFDDIAFASIFEPSLTTIAQPSFEMGETAMKLLIKQLNKEEIEKKQYILEDKLIIRETSRKC